MRFFKDREFVCKCGCGRGADQMDARLLNMLDSAREKAGFPLVLSSAFRCPAHNKTIGGISDSSHLTGKAVDIRCNSSQTRFTLLRALLAAGFNRIELAPTWIHVDVDGHKTQNVAFYP